MNNIRLGKKGILQWAGTWYLMTEKECSYIHNDVLEVTDFNEQVRIIGDSVRSSYEI